jgi:hypothetical protein
MEKTCFVIMPISEMQPYEIGHFKRVYDFIIKPSVIKAGFKPIRADDILNTNYIAIDIIKRVINSEMALCDLSSRNPNVLYELGIRQAFNLPVTFIRDSITSRIFDVQGFRDIEYDEKLRIDNVETITSTISETITNTYESKKTEEINSLVSLLGIQAAKISNKHQISTDTELILNALQSLGSRIIDLEKAVSPIEKPSFDFSIDSNNSDFKEIALSNANELKVGDIVVHRKYGNGKILGIEGTKNNPIASVVFESGEDKKLMLNYAALKKLIKNIRANDESK